MNCWWSLWWSCDGQMNCPPSPDYCWEWHQHHLQLQWWPVYIYIFNKLVLLYFLYGLNKLVSCARLYFPVQQSKGSLSLCLSRPLNLTSCPVFLPWCKNFQCGAGDPSRWGLVSWPSLQPPPSLSSSFCQRYPPARAVTKPCVPATSASAWYR